MVVVTTTIISSPDPLAISLTITSAIITVDTLLDGLIFGRTWFVGLRGMRSLLLPIGHRETTVHAFPRS
jgi:hypothetical protein